jgi:hypothetical protein
MRDLACPNRLIELQRRDAIAARDGNVEFLAVTLWESIDSVRAFSGQDPNVAIVEPEGRAALASFSATA